MRRTALAVALALLLVPSAAGGSATRTIGTRGRVVEISADGGRVTIHAVLAGEPDCNSGSVWQPSTGKVVRFQDTPCGKRASDQQYDSLTLAGTRAVWTDYDFGNHAYCAGPYTATLAKPKPVDTGKCPGQPGNEDLYWEYKGDGGLLVARSYTRCEASCPPNFDRTYDAGVTIWSIGARLAKLVAAKDDTKLLDGDAGRILLLDPAKKLLVLNASGTQVGAVAPAGRGAAFMSGSAQVVGVSKGSTLTVYDVASGQAVKTVTMKGQGKLFDVENGVAAYFSGTQVRLLTLATGRDRLVATQKGLVQADLEPSGLYYAYNVPGGGPKPGRVTFVPLAALPQ
jgi:hypothetical protein